tara:strand:+ start:7006 stop:7656 length:651 start_codon:yes stop_codon:yes gene_type:complete
LDRFKNDQRKIKSFKNTLILSKVKKIAGVDEVGRGCLAGPVFAAAVILNDKIDIRNIKDSKKISFKKRILLSKYIRKNSIYAVGYASVKEIEKINILNASLLSMNRALKNLKYKPSMIYIDGMFAPPNLKIKYKTVIKGDEKILCIAAASIVAKVARDLFMIKLAKKYPHYRWNKNFGYGTADHMNGIKKYGITKHHRKKFKPIHNILIGGTRETQ